MKRTISTLAFCSLVATVSPVNAQYDPGATQMFGEGMGFSALSDTTYRNAIEATRQDGSERKARPARSDKRQDARQKARDDSRAKEPVLRTQADVDRYMNERMAHHIRALTPEYKRRAARDGQPAADRWIRAKGEELGKMEGERARKLVKRD